MFWLDGCERGTKSSREFGAFLNGLQVYQLNRSGREMFSSWGQYVRKIERFVNTHKHEKDFSYRFINHDDGKFIQVIASYGSDRKRIAGYVSDYLFREYTTTRSPKYYLVYNSQKEIVSFRDKDQAQQYLNDLIN